MSTETDFSLAEHTRIMQNIVLIGTVQEIDLDKARVRIKIGDLLTNWLPWITQRAGDDISWWSPSQNEQVVIFSPGGDLAQGVCLPAIYSDANPANSDSDKKHKVSYSDGAVFEYDKESHTLTLDLPDGGKVNITADVHINGDLSVDGDITATGDITDKTRSMAGDRMIYNIHTHPEPDGSTSAPTQQQ